MEQKVALVSRGLVLLLSWWTASDNKTDLTRTGTWFGSIKIRAPCKDTKAKRRREGRTHVRVKEKSNAMQSGNMDSTALPLAPKRGTPWNNNIYIDPLIATPSELHCMGAQVPTMAPLPFVAFVCHASNMDRTTTTAAIKIQEHIFFLKSSFGWKKKPMGSSFVARFTDTPQAPTTKRALAETRCRTVGQ
jgi:hypothetical protein